MLSLFDAFDRTDHRYMKEGESAFDYLNRSARPYSGAKRGILEGWYAAYPEGQDKAELRERFRSSDDIPHLGAVFELLNHALLRSMGLDVRIHPPVPNETGRHPDFLALRDGEPLFYLEGTLAHPSDSFRACDRERIRILRGLEKLSSPDFYLCPAIDHMSERQVDLPKLRASLREWLAGYDPDQLERRYQAEGDQALPRFSWTDAGWTITFTAYPRNKSKRGFQGQRVVGPRIEPIPLNAADRLRRAVKGKAGHYGPLDLPYIVAVNVIDKSMDDIDIMEGLFGKETFALVRTPEGPKVGAAGREPNGAFYGPKGLTNKGVSAVLICHQITPGDLDHRKTVLVHHPGARHPLDRTLWPLPQLAPHLTEARMTQVEGRTLGEVLGIADPWIANAD